MASLVAEIVAFVLEIYLDIKFWFQKKKRRKLEKERNLPKKTMVHPLDKLLLIVLFILIIVVPIYFLFFYPNLSINKTQKKLINISKILEKEKAILGTYPETLNSIIRNNPLRQNITIDYWENEFQYELLDKGEAYTLFSSGKDGISNTDDDIKLNQ